MDTSFISFSKLRSKAIESTDKVAFLVCCFNVLHSEAPPYDFENLGGRIAAIYKQANKDVVRVLQVMWIASANGIQGSHLNYMQGMLRKSNGQKKIDTGDRDKFTKGEYGHLVKK
jgi:hypothetical protein